MTAGTTALIGRRILATFVAAMMVLSVMFLLAEAPAQADHVQPDDVVANDGPAGTNDAPYWVNYLASVRGIDDATCEKIDQDDETAWVMPAEPAGRDWVLLVVKQGDDNYVFYDPVAGHTYPSEGPNAPGYSHIIVCSAPEETTTTTVEDTTTTSVEDTTTTSVEDTTTTSVEDTTTTSVEDTTTTVDIGGSTVTTAPADTTTTVNILDSSIVNESTSTTVEDEVKGTEVLPFTGVDTDLLALLAAGLGLMGGLVLAATRRIEDN